MGKKIIFTLAVDGYSPEIVELTFPFLRHYARKIGADFHVIEERKFHGWPVTVEKLQIYELAKKMDCEWAIFFDADALIHPETIDFIPYLSKDTVAHNGSDFGSVRWRYDKYFLRDGRNIGSCNWCSIASEWCLDLWHPPDDITRQEALDAIYPTIEELNTVITHEHLIDDYLLSRNIARYGLKFTTLMSIQKRLGFAEDKTGFFWHAYVLTAEEKIKQMKEIISAWNVPKKLFRS